MVAIATDPVRICLYCHDFVSLLSGLKYTYVAYKRNVRGLHLGPVVQSLIKLILD